MLYRIVLFPKIYCYTVMKNINIAFGKRVQYLRKKKNVSQLQFSNENEISTGYLAEIESGMKGRNPTLDIIAKIAQGLDISLAELFTGIDETDTDIKSLKMKSEFLEILNTLDKEQLDKALSMLKILASK